jgi:pimeloyl-ACP methyl ester carboxylesterase
MRVIATTGILAVMLLWAACGEPVKLGERIELKSDDWVIVGDLVIPESAYQVPAVLLLHMKPADRTSYDTLAELLAERHMASLRIDLRGHGESINKGKADDQIDSEAWRDVLAAFKYLADNEKINPDKIGILGASYSGEAAARAGREGAWAKAYVILSSGSFSEESIQFVATSEAHWQFIAAEEDDDVAALMQRAAAAAPGYAAATIYPHGGHGTALFQQDRELEKKIANWFLDHLK